MLMLVYIIFVAHRHDLNRQTETSQRITMGPNGSFLAG
jgi:hypothetical protein